MVDLVTQYEKMKPEIDTAMADVMKTAAFIKGPEVKTLEQNLEQYLNIKHVVACANGTDALQIALMALELKPGDEVITPCFSYAASCEVILLLKLIPVFVDVNPFTFNMDIEATRNAITAKTKAIIPVHLFGQCADMEPLLNLAREHHLWVIEDAAQSMGASYTFGDGSVAHAGTMGIIGTTSFFPSKNLGCFGDGGALFTNDDAMAHKIRRIANHGQSKPYFHDEIGVNSRLDSIQAAVLNIKLKKLEGYHTARKKAADYYDQAFFNHKNIVTPFRSACSTHVFHQYSLQLIDTNREALIRMLDSKQIPSTIYYPIPLNEQKAYLQEGNYPVTSSLCKTVLSLPMHTELEEEQLEMITHTILDFLK